MLKKLVERALENLSSKEVFLFRISCGNCGRDCSGKPVRFSKAGASLTTRSARILYEALYEQEFKTAMQVAVLTASEQLNHCPICKRLVCNQCFLICQDLDMCRQCATALEQQGQPVQTSFLEVI